jgi:glycosyltransferase involved in cell wall biosynthesis
VTLVTSCSDQSYWQAGNVLPWRFSALSGSSRPAIAVAAPQDPRTSKKTVKTVKVSAEPIEAGMQSDPLVSVVVPAYNAAQFIEQTLVSVLTQTYSHFEVLVVDDGSQDRTPDLVRAIAAQDQRVQLLQQPNRGVAAARNLGIQQARGEYIAPLDADDIWYPQKLEKQVQAALDGGASVGVVYAWSVYIDEEGLPSRDCQVSNMEGEVVTALIHKNFLGNASSPLIRRTCLEQSGGYSSAFKEQQAQGCEDWDLYLRLAEKCQFRLVPEILIGYRQVLGSMSFNQAAMTKSFEIFLEGAQKRHPEIPEKLYQLSRSNFDWYLCLRSKQCGDHWKTIYYLYKSAKLDTSLFFSSRFYKITSKSLAKLLAKPLASLLWPDHQAWLAFKYKLKSPQSPPEIAQLNQWQRERRNLFS